MSIVCSNTSFGHTVHVCINDCYYIYVYVCVCVFSHSLQECRHLFEYGCHVPYESAVKRKIHSLEKIATLLLTHRV